MADTTARGIQFPVDADAWDYQAQQQDMAETADTAIGDLAAITTLVAFSRTGTGQTVSIPSGASWSRPQQPTVEYNDDATTMSYDGTFNAVVVSVAALVHFSAHFTIDDNSNGGSRDISIARYNTSEVLQERRATNRVVIVTSGTAFLSTSWTFLCDAGDKLAGEVRQASGGTAANMSESAFVATINRNDG